MQQSLFVSTQAAGVYLADQRPPLLAGAESALPHNAARCLQLSPMAERERVLIQVDVTVMDNAWGYEDRP